MNASGHDGPAAALRRIRLIAKHTLTEALHLRLSLLLASLGAGLGVGSWWLREFNFGSAELRFLADFGLGAIGLGGTFLAALATAHLFFGDLAGGAAACVLTRPVRRGEYIAGMLAGLSVLLALFTALLALLVGALLVWRAGQLHSAFPDLPFFFAACGLQWLKSTLVAALTLLVCTHATTALFASCAGLLLAIAGHLRPFLREGGVLSWLRCWPNFGLFDPDVLLAAPHSISGAWLAGILLYWAVYLTLLGALAAWVFHHREF